MPTNKFYKKPKKEDSAGVRIPDAVPAHNQNPTNSKGYRYANPSNSHTYGSAGAKVRGDYNPEQRIQNSYGLDRQRSHEMDARRVRDQFVLMDLYTRANRAQRQAEEEARNRQAQSRSFNDTMNLLDYYSQRPSYSYATPGGTVSVPLSNEKPMQGDQLAEALRAKQAQDYMQSEIDRRYRQQRAGADLRAEREAKRNGVILNPEDEVTPSYNALTDDRFMRDLSNRADFERNSQYKAGSTFTGDLINNAGDTRQLMENATTMAQGMNQSGSSVLPYPYVQDYMDENEKNTYNYLLNTYGQDKAEEYFKQIEPELNRKWSEAYNQNVENFSTQNPVMGAIASALSVPGKGIYDTAQMIQMLAGAGMSKATGEPLDINNPYMTMTNTFGTMRNAVNEQVTEEGGEWAGWAYGTAMSIADNLYQLGMAGGFGANTEAAKKQSENLVLGLMGTGAAAASIRENIESGMDQDRAVALGIGSGLIEVITEKIGMDNLFNTAWTEGKGSFTQMIKMLAKQAASEGAEEGLSDIMNWSADYLYDVITAKNEASWYRDFADQKAQHPELTDNEIWGLVYNNMAKELGMDILGGAVSGFAMGGGMTALGVNNARGEINRNAEALTSADVQDVIEGARVSESKKANAMADALQEKLDSGQEITDKEVQDTYKASAMADYVNEMTKEGYLEERTGQQVQQDKQNDMERLGLNENEIEDYYRVRNAAAIDTAEELTAFDKDFLDNYRAGQDNISTNLIKAKEGASTVMSPQLRMTANNLGRMYSIRNNNGQYLDMDKIRADEVHEVFKAYSSPGFVETKASTLLNISKETKVKMDLMAKGAGVKLVFVESIVDEKGKSIANGAYQDGVILIALDSTFGKEQLGKSWTQEKAYRLTFGHELAHRLAVTSPDAFNTLRDAIIEFKGENAVKSSVKYKMDNEGSIGRKISEAAAMEESVADFLSYEAFEEGIFEDFIETQLNTSAGVKTLEKLKNAFSNLLKKLRGVKGLEDENKKAQKVIDQINAVLKDAAKKVAKAEKVEMSDATLQAKIDRAEGRYSTKEIQKLDINNDLKAVMEKGGYRMPDNGAYSVRTEILWDQALKTLAEGHENTQEYRNAVQLVHSMTKQVLNDEEMLNFVPTGLPGGNPLRSNIEYIVTFDMDALCPRTYEFGAYRDAVEKRLGRKMNEKEARALIENLRAYGMMIPCTYCYVESKRMALNTAYNKYFELYDQIAGAKTDKQAYAFVPENAYNHKTNTWKNNTKGWQDRFAGWRALKNNKYSTSPEEMYRKVSQAEAAVYNWLDSEYDKPENFILSADGFKDFKLPQKSKAQAAMFDHFGIEMKEKAKRGAQVQLEGMFEQWLYDMQMGVPHNVNPEFNDSTEVDAEALDFHHEALKYAKSSSQAHGVDNYAPYSDQILKLTTAQKAVINARGGIRKHSSNDFRLDNLVDYVQFYTHLALDKRGGFGWFGHTYTKDTLFAELFAPTNDRINMSIAMFGDGGRLGEIRPNLAEGADWNEVKRLRNKYDNLGAMAMVTNNAQLSYALNSDWIDMIIPFHASGMTKELYNDVMAWYDYTSVQSDKLYTNKQLKEMGVNPAKVTRVYEYYKGEKDGWVRAKKPRQVHFLPGDQYIGTKGEEYLEHLNDENYKGDLKAEYDELVKSGNIIPGHENSSEKYLELCKQYGVKPRFSGIMVQDSSGNTIDITEHPNYVKALKETARTDTQQKEITMEGFDLDYAMSQLKARSAHGGYNTVKGNEAIVNDFVENVINKKKPVGYVTAKALATKFAGNTTALSEIIDENGEYLTEGMTVDELREFELNHPTETKSLGSASVRLSAKDDEFSDADTRFSIRTEDPPKKTGIAYKVFLAKDGKLYPPMVANPGGEATPVGVWLNADVAPMAGLSKTGRPQVQAGGKGTNTGKSTLAFRPGWHLGDVPLAKQFARVNPETGLKELFPANFVWAECEYAMDVDYQHEADEMGYMRTNSDGSSYKSDKYQHSLAGLKKIPKNGYYHYRTNPNPDTVPWVITGAMKVNRILNDSEVNEILRQKGIKPMKRQGGPIDLQALGFQNESRYSAKEDSLGRELSPEQQEFFKNSKVRDENGHLLVGYHTTDKGGFTIFDPKFSDDKMSLFFATNYAVSQTYSSNGGSQIDFDKTPTNAPITNVDDLRNRFGDIEDYFSLSLETNPNDPLLKYVTEPINEYVSGVSVNEWFEKARYYSMPGLKLKYTLPDLNNPERWLARGHALNAEELFEEINKTYHLNGKQQGFYKCYFNITNPLIVDAQGSDWKSIPYDPNGAGKKAKQAIDTIKAKLEETTHIAVKNIDVNPVWDEDGEKMTGYDVKIVARVKQTDGTWKNDIINRNIRLNPSDFIDEDGDYANDAAGYELWNQFYEWMGEYLGYECGEFIDRISDFVSDVDGGLRYKSADPTGYDWFEDDGFWVDYMNRDIEGYEGLTDQISRYIPRKFKTRELAKVAKESGHNGVLIRNVIDLGGASRFQGNDKLSDIIIAFDSNQVKDVNNLTPTENPDIRYSAKEDSLGRTLSPGQIDYFKDSKVRDENGNLLVVYHGTDANFNVFKPDSWSNERNGENQIKGYFSEDEEYSESYGIVKPYYLNITKPLEISDNKARTLKEWKKWLTQKGVKGVVFDSSLTQEKDDLVGAVFEGDTQRRYAFYELVANAGYYWDEDGNVTTKIKEAGYDGIRWDYGEKAWMPFEENSAKKTDNLNPTDNPDIRYSVKYSAEEMDAHRQALMNDMKENYGSAFTDNYNEAGYVFPNGRMLKMGAYGQRGDDHAIATLAYDDIGYDTYNSPKFEAQKRFINEGNIRYMPEMGWLNFGTAIEPTPEQYRWIRDAIDEMGVTMIEFTDMEGNSVDSKEYSGNETPSAIINDIKRFYRDGRIGGSTLAQFRYSLKTDLAYHAGDLGKAESLFQQSGGRSTGHFGSGTYFVGNPEKIKGYNSRNGAEAPVETVDFSKYNLFKPKDYKDAQVLHDFFKGVDDRNVLFKGARSSSEYDRYVERMRELDYDWGLDEDNALQIEEIVNLANKTMGSYQLAKTIQREIPRLSGEHLWTTPEGRLFLDGNGEIETTPQELISKLDIDDQSVLVSRIADEADSWDNRRMTNRVESWEEQYPEAARVLGIPESRLRTIAEIASKEAKEIGYPESKTADSIATRIMKTLGYEGIDVRHIKEMDNTTYGSVVYDLKGEDLARKNEIGTARWSLKADMDAYEIMNRVSALEKENARLAKMVENYKLQNRRSDADHVARAQGKIPVMDTITEKAAKDLAKDIVKTYNAAVPTGDLSKQIQKASLLMVREAARPAAMRGTNQAAVDDALWKVACDMAEKILDNSRDIPNAELTGYREQFDHYETVNLLAGDILERMMKAEKVKPTKADKNAMKLQETRRAANKRLQDAIKRERTNKEKAIADLKAHNKEVQQNKRARHEASVERTRLLRVADRLKKLKTTKANRALIEQTIRDVIGGDLATVYKTMTGERLEKLQALKAWYEGKITEGSPTYDPDFETNARIEAEIKELEQLHVNDLNLEQVTMLNDVLRYLENEIRTNKKTINTSDQRLAADQGFQIIKDTRATEGINHLEKLQKSIITEVLRPETLVKRIIGYNYSSPLWERFQDLEDGQLEMVRYQMQANRMFDKFISDKKFWKMMTGKHAEELTLRGIDTETNEPVELKITPAMRMSIYLHSLNEDNMRHMSKGGLTVPEISAYKKGNLQKAYDKATTVRISQSYARSLYDQMSVAEKAYLETVQRYFNEVSTPAINEVSNLLKGYDIAEVENYFPINTDQAFSRTAFGEMKHDGSIEGMGSLKERVKNAMNPILLVEVEDVVNRAVKDNSKYVGLAIPIRNFNKVMGINQNSFDSKGNWKGVETSVQREIAKKWGSFTMDYLNNLFDDLQNPKGLRDNNGAWFQKLQSKYAGGVLELNAGVAIKQAASLPTAAAVLGYGPILRAMANVGRLDEANYYKYSPLGEYRERGYASQELGDIKEQGIKLPKGLNWIQAMDSMTVRKLFKASEYYVRENYPNLTVGSEAYWKKVGEVHTDVITQTQPNYTTLQRPQILRSQNTLVKALNMFKTQPFQNFNILFEAAGEFRATGNRLKMADTAENRAAHKAAGRKLARAISSQLLSSLVFALMQAAWDLFRKKDKKYRDEDEELTFGSFLGGIGLNMLTNAGGMLPWMNTILEWGMSLTDALTKELTGEQIFGGQRFYGMEVGVLSNLTDTADALKNAVVKTVKYFNDNENVTGYDAVGEMIDATADVLTTLGLPAENFRNDIYAAYNWIYQGITGEETNVDSSTIFDTETRTKNSNAKKMASGIEDDPIYTRYLAEREKHPDYKKAEYNVSKSATKLEFDKDESYEKYSGIMSKDEYILYNLALQTADMQNDANGSYKQTERAQALDMLDFLTKQEKSQIWTDVLGYKSNNPYN
jgi:hypothetical protein